MGFGFACSDDTQALGNPNALLLAQWGGGEDNTMLSLEPLGGTR